MSRLGARGFGSRLGAFGGTRLGAFGGGGEDGPFVYATFITGLNTLFHGYRPLTVDQLSTVNDLELVFTTTRTGGVHRVIGAGNGDILVARNNAFTWNRSQRLAPTDFFEDGISFPPRYRPYDMSAVKWVSGTQWEYFRKPDGVADNDTYGERLWFFCINDAIAHSTANNTSSNFDTNNDINLSDQRFNVISWSRVDNIAVVSARTQGSYSLPLDPNGFSPIVQETRQYLYVIREAGGSFLIEQRIVTEAWDVLGGVAPIQDSTGANGKFAHSVVCAGATPDQFILRGVILSNGSTAPFPEPLPQLLGTGAYATFTVGDSSISSATEITGASPHSFLFDRFDESSFASTLVTGETYFHGVFNAPQNSFNITSKMGGSSGNWSKSEADGHVLHGDGAALRWWYPAVDPATRVLYTDATKDGSVYLVALHPDTGSLVGVSAALPSHPTSIFAKGDYHPGVWTPDVE